MLAFSLDGCGSSTPLVGYVEISPQVPGQYVSQSLLNGKISKSWDGSHLVIRNDMFRFPGNETLVCVGPYDPSKTSGIVNVDLACLNGRRGTALIKRDGNGLNSGSGTFDLSDGSYGAFQFGAEMNRGRAD